MWCVCLALASSQACKTPDDWKVDADAEVGAVVRESTTEVLAAREDWILQPEETDDSGAVDPDRAAIFADEGKRETQSIDLESSLGAAFTSSREFITRKETLYLQGLGLSQVRFNFGPQLDAAVSTVFANQRGGPLTRDTSGSLGLSQLLPTGGTFALSGSLAHLRSGSPTRDQAYTSSVDLSLSQPLLRGSGYEVSHEALTQAERSMLYAIRDFELFRQDHAISIASDFFDLVSQRTQLDNEERRYEEAVFDREKSEALRQLDRNQDEDVFLARRNEINAENGVLVARADYERELDTFRIRLGLPEGQKIAIVDAEPPFQSVRLDADSAVRVALHNRLDLITAREVLEDTQRALRIARDGLRTDVDLDLGYGRSGVNRKSTGDNGTGGNLIEDWSHSAGLSVEIPLQRTTERNVYRSALIDVDRANRNYEIQLENVDRDIRDALRQLGRTEQQIDLQVDQIAQEERAVAVTLIRYEAGDVENRDLLEARQALVDAQNALITLKVDHFISRLQLYRDLGLLFVEEDGMWRL